MRFRPCIDLRNGRVVQIVGATLDDDDAAATVTHFEARRSAADFARMYRRDGLCGGHVIGLGAGNEQAMLAALRAWPGGLQAGGGMRPDNAARYLDAGASHVIVTSYLFDHGRFSTARLESMRRAVGRERLVLDLSCRWREDGYYVVTDRWQRFTNLPIDATTLSALAEHCDELLVHGVEAEGKRLGIIEPLVELLATASPITVTYAGGLRDLEDLELVERLGRGRVDVTIGSALDIFGGSLPYRELVRWQLRRQEGGRAH